MNRTVNFSAQDFMTKFNAEIERQGIENLGATVDNTGVVVISNSDTGEEITIQDNSTEDIENFLKFILENGVTIDKSNIANFSEITNFGLGKAVGNTLKAAGSNAVNSLISPFKGLYKGGESLVNGISDITEKISDWTKTNSEKLSKGKILDKFIIGVAFQKSEIKILKDATRYLLRHFKKKVSSNSFMKGLYNRTNLKPIYESLEKTEKVINKIIKKVGKNKCLKAYQNNMRRYKDNLDASNNLKDILGRDNESGSNTSDYESQIKELKNQALKLLYTKDSNGKKIKKNEKELSSEDKNEILKIKQEIKKLENQKDTQKKKEEAKPSTKTDAKSIVNHSVTNFDDYDAEKNENMIIGEAIVSMVNRIYATSAKLEAVKLLVESNGKLVNYISKFEKLWSTTSKLLAKALKELDYSYSEDQVKTYKQSLDNELTDFTSELLGEEAKANEEELNNSEPSFDKLNKLLDGKLDMLNENNKGIVSKWISDNSIGNEDKLTKLAKLTNINDDDLKSAVSKLGKKSDEQESLEDNNSQESLEEPVKQEKAEESKSENTLDDLAKKYNTSTDKLNKIKEAVEKTKKGKRAEFIKKQCFPNGTFNQAKTLLKELGFSEEISMKDKYTNFSDELDKITSKITTHFDAHKVKDSEYGIAYEDKFGSLWAENPDEKADAELLWESKDGKEQPSGSVQGESIMNEDEMNDTLGMSDEEAGMNDDLEGDDSSMDSDDEFSLDDSEDTGDDEGEGNEGGEDLGFSEDSDDDFSLEDDSTGDDFSLEDDNDESSEDDDFNLDDDADSDFDLGGEEDDLSSEETTNEDALKAAQDTIKQMTPIIEKLIDKIN